MAKAALPLRYEENKGQFPKEVAFFSRTENYSVAIGPTEATFLLKAAGRPDGRAQLSDPSLPSIVRMRFEGSRKGASITGEEKLPGATHYFLGADPAAWRQDVRGYGKVRARQLYPGVDVLYKGTDRRLEWDFIVAPGADIERIRLAFDGAERVQVTPEGELVIETAAGQIRQHRPVGYQDIDGSRQAVHVEYASLGKTAAGFRVAKHDPARILVIDPVVSFSTYLGRRGDETAGGVALDSEGQIYVTGSTSSTDFPTTDGAFDTTYRGGQLEAFVTKFSADGSTLVYSTFIGGSRADIGRGIVVDKFGAAYVVGATVSTDFPTTPGAIQTSLAGDFDAFVAKLSPDGSTLLYSTYLGGSRGDGAGGVTVDESGNAFVVGQTESDNFPVTGRAYQPSSGGGSDVFVAKLNESGSALVYSTYVGENGNDYASAIAIDDSGNAYIAGSTDGRFDVTPDALQRTVAGGYDAFIMILNADGTDRLYCTLFGGRNLEGVGGLALDAYGDIYIAGLTNSIDLPTTSGSFQPAYGGGFYDGFVTKLTSGGRAIEYSTYLGGSGNDVVNAIRVDALGNAFIAGSTSSENFPVTKDAFQLVPPGHGDAFVTQLDSAGKTLRYSTYLGGAEFDDVARGIALDGNGGLYVAGETRSTDFPTTEGAFQTRSGRDPHDLFLLNDAFLTRFALDSD